MSGFDLFPAHVPATHELEPLPYYSYSSSYVPAPTPIAVPDDPAFGDGFYSYTIDQTAHEANLEHTPVGPFVDPFESDELKKTVAAKNAEKSALDEETVEAQMLSHEYYKDTLDSPGTTPDRVEELLPYSDDTLLEETPAKKSTLETHYASPADHWDTFAPNRNPMNWGVTLDCPPYAPDCNGDGGSKGTGTAFGAPSDFEAVPGGTTSQQLEAGKLSSNSGVVNVGIEGKPVQYSAFMPGQAQKQVDSSAAPAHSNDTMIVPIGMIALTVGFLLVTVLTLFKRRQRRMRRATSLLPSSAATREDATNLASL